MTCRQIEFEEDTWLIEVVSQPADTGRPECVAYLSLVEDHGAIVRPLVAQDGHRVSVLGPTEPAAMRAAVDYLESRFNSVSVSTHECALGASSVGQPVNVRQIERRLAL